MCSGTRNVYLNILINISTDYELRLKRHKQLGVKMQFFSKESIANDVVQFRNQSIAAEMRKTIKRQIYKIILK